MQTLQEPAARNIIIIQIVTKLQDPSILYQYQLYIHKKDCKTILFSYKLHILNVLLI